MCRVRNGAVDWASRFGSAENEFGGFVAADSAGRVRVLGIRDSGWPRQDLFTADFSEATVMSLYLFPEMNERLRPKLQRELRPGARVVSHQFRIGDWPPDRSETVWSGSVDHQLFLWIVPPR